MKSNKNIIKKFKILVLKSYWRAALNPLAGRMRPAGRVFEVPALKQHCNLPVPLKQHCYLPVPPKQHCLPSSTPKAIFTTFVYPLVKPKIINCTP